MVLFVLFEHAAGYAIFRCQEAEDIGSLLPEVQEAVLDFARFGSVIFLEAFVPFKTGANALENLNCISEGLIHDDLKVFLMNNVPQGKKKSKVLLGVADPKLGATIQETLDIHCQSVIFPTAQVSSEGLLALASGQCAKVLKELNVSHCLNVTDEGIQSVVTQCQRLSILVSHGCPLLTNLSRDIASNGRRLKQITWTVY